MVLNEDDFRRLVAGHEVVHNVDGGAGLVSIRVALSDIGWDSMLESIAYARRNSDSRSTMNYESGRLLGLLPDAQRTQVDIVNDVDDPRTED